MITSEELLRFGRSNNPCFLSYLLSARDYRSIITKCVFADPNYGACWFRAKIFPLGSAEEVIIRTIKFTAHEIAIASNVYYNAVSSYANCKQVRQQPTINVSDTNNRHVLIPVSTQYQQPQHLNHLSTQSNHSLSSSPCSSLTQYHRLLPSHANIRNSTFSFSFQPYQMVVYSCTLPAEKKLKILFGTSQIESW